MAKEQVAEKGARKEGTMKYVPIILTAVVLEVVLAYFLVTKIIAPQMRAAAQGTSLEEEGEQKSKTIGKIYEIKDIIVNPAGTGGTRYLNTTVGLEVENEKLFVELESRMPQIRDALIDILVGKTIDQLDGVEDKRLLREEILIRINDMLPDSEKEKVVHVYFIDFVIQ